MSDETYWNGEKCRARKVRVIVGTPRLATFWYADLVGTERSAVEVSYGKEVFLIDDEDGSGWRKVTSGMGSPRFGHKSLSGKVVGATHAAD